MKEAKFSIRAIPEEISSAARNTRKSRNTVIPLMWK